MPTETLTLDEEMSSFVNDEIASGRFHTRAEVIGAGLHALKMEEQIYDKKIEILRAAIAEGDASGEAEGDIFNEIRAEIGLPKRKR